MKNKTAYIVLLCAFILLAPVAGCGKFKKPAEKIVAKVNGDPVYASDIKRELALKMKVDPFFKVTPQTLENEVDAIINRRLLIQEAQKLKLDRTDRFVDTIKTFWEQTLIRELIVAKNKDFESGITVTDEEIRGFHSKLGEKVTFKIIKRKDRSLLERMLGVEKGLIAWEETIGPVEYQDIDSKVLQAAFGLPRGEARIFRDKDDHYLVYVAEKTPGSAPPLEEIRGNLEEQIKRGKQAQRVKEWLLSVKDRAEIEIDKKSFSAFGAEKQ